jgi:hypothetical protein
VGREKGPLLAYSQAKLNVPLISRKYSGTVPGLLFSDKAIFILSSTAGSDGLAYPLDCLIRADVTFIGDTYAQGLPTMIARVAHIFAEMLIFIIVLLPR